MKDDTCVLLPREYLKFREELNPVYQSIADVLLHSQLRIEEFWWFVDHPASYRPARRCISLPKEAITKTETRYKSRDVILSIKGCEVVQHFIDMKLTSRKDRVTREAMGQAFKGAAVRAGLGGRLIKRDPPKKGGSYKSDGICPKMLRKTGVSWLVALFPERGAWINASAGHTSDIQLKHYLGIAFPNTDKDDMMTFLRGWGEA